MLSKSDAEKQMKRYVVQNYGNLISISEPKFEPESKTWLAELHSDYPRIIHDDRSEERMVKFLSLGHLGIVRFGEEMKPTEATPREKCVQNLTSLLNMWQERAERIIVSASSDSLAKLDETQWVLSKIGMLISSLEHEEMIWNSELESYGQKEKQKIIKYLRLLEGLEIVKKIDGGFTYGNMFAELRRNCGEFYEFKIAILSYVLKNRYPVLKELFGILQLEPYVHVESCYYRPALEIEDTLYSTSDSILRSYRKTYGYKSDLRLTYVLRELVNSNTLCYEDKFYFANQQIFKNMLELKNKSHSLVPIQA
jgi:hypothetical protein